MYYAIKLLPVWIKDDIKNQTLQLCKIINKSSEKNEIKTVLKAHKKNQLKLVNEKKLKEFYFSFFLGY